MRGELFLQRFNDTEDHDSYQIQQCQSLKQRHIASPPPHPGRDSRPRLLLVRHYSTNCDRIQPPGCVLSLSFPLQNRPSGSGQAAPGGNRRPAKREPSRKRTEQSAFSTMVPFHVYRASSPRHPLSDTCSEPLGPPTDERRLRDERRLSGEAIKASGVLRGTLYKVSPCVVGNRITSPPAPWPERWRAPERRAGTARSAQSGR